MTITKEQLETRNKVDEKNITPNVIRTEYDNGDVVFTAQIVDGNGKDREKYFLSPAAIGLEEIPEQQAKDYVAENNRDPLVSKLQNVNHMPGKGFRVKDEVGEFKVDEAFLKEEFGDCMNSAKAEAEILGMIVSKYPDLYATILRLKASNKAPNSDRPYASPHSEYNLNFTPGENGDEDGMINIKAKVRTDFDKKEKPEILQKTLSVSRFNGNVKEAKNVAKEIQRYWIKASVDFLYEQLVYSVKGDDFYLVLEKIKSDRDKIRRKLFELEARLGFMDLQIQKQEERKKKAEGLE